VVHSEHILVVDEDSRSRQLLRSILAAGGYEVEEARDADHAQECLHRTAAEIVIVDAASTALDELNAWRKASATPNLALIAIGTRSSEQEEVDALEAGADDYIKRPLSAPRLLARIGAVLRRVVKSAPKTEPAVVHLENCEIDLKARRINSRGRQIRLTPTECELLNYFIANPNVPIPHAQVLEAVWGPACASQTDYIRTFVTQLRRKIEPDPSHPRYLLTEPWVGYRFAMPSPANSGRA
jgi:two-component system KDP operon response regulator KdpE